MIKDITNITLAESIYLFYMFFIFKTSYSFNSALFNKEIQSLSSFFVHDSGYYENKICDFGRVMAGIAIILAFIRLNYIDNSSVASITITFDVICLILAALLNTNALIYILPLVMCEIFIIKSLIK